MPAKRIAIVTGGNRGIGHEIARQLMKSDVFVVIGCRTEAKCSAAVEALSPMSCEEDPQPMDGIVSLR